MSRGVIALTLVAIIAENGVISIGSGQSPRQNRALFYMQLWRVRLEQD